MEPKTQMAHEWQQQATDAAQHWILPAFITAAVGAVANYIRTWPRRRQMRTAVAQNVAEIRQVMIAPDDPKKDDLRTLVEQTRAEQAAHVILLEDLRNRFDVNLELQATRHAELKTLIRDFRR